MEEENVLNNEKPNKFLDFILKNFKKLHHRVRTQNINVFFIVILMLFQLISFSVFCASVKISFASFGFITDIFTFAVIDFIILYLFRGKLRKGLYTATFIMNALIMCADTMYFKYFCDIASIVDLKNLMWLESGYGVSLPIGVYLILGLLVLHLVFFFNLHNIQKRLYKNHDIKKMMKNKKIKKVINTILVTLFILLFTQALVNNSLMMYRPKFDSYSDYVLSKYYLYDNMNNSVLFSQNWGYMYCRLVDIFGGMF